MIKKSKKYYGIESKYISNIVSPNYINVYEKSWFEETVRLPFENIEVNALVGFKELLTTMYGDYMKLPPEEKRIAPHDYGVIYPSAKFGNNIYIAHSNNISIGDITIGDNCIIGAGAIVTKSVPDNSVVLNVNKIRENKHNNQEIILVRHINPKMIFLQD